MPDFESFVRFFRFIYLFELEFDELSELTEFSFFFLSLFRNSASSEGGQNGGLVRLQGHRDILQKRGHVGAKQRGKLSQPVVLPDLQGKGTGGKEA